MGKEMWGINLPQEIEFSFCEDENCLHMHINHPEKPMYADSAAFEAWALFLHGKKKCDVKLSFENVNWAGAFEDLHSEQANYMRFLYRAWKFSDDDVLPWFKIAPENKGIVKRFKDKFRDLKNENLLRHNIPTCEAEISSSDSKTEHHFENAFVNQASGILSSIVKNADQTIIKQFNNQLPVGLFEDVIQNKSRIFPTGYLDLWGISEANDFCLFELKVADTGGKDNDFKQAGIISELFFYANYCKDIFMDQTNVEVAKKSYRRYEQLQEAQKKEIKKIRAYFLAPQYHSQIDTNFVENQLNQIDKSISYKFLKYTYSEIKPIAEQIKQTAKK